MFFIIHLDRRETPPRAWGRRTAPRCSGPFEGNTPTGVGKTFSALPRSICPKKHPHGRGEDQRPGGLFTCQEETPPRAWGRLNSKNIISRSRRNTPTGVGKTYGLFCFFAGTQKHPHGRGEDKSQIRFAILR